MHLRICSALLVTGLTLGMAASPCEAAPQDKRLARHHFTQGKRHFLAGEYTRAVRAFERAFRHRPHRVILFNIALAHAHRGDALAAATHLRRYLRRAHPTDPPLPAVLRRVRRRVGVLSVRVKNPRARIYIDGRFVGEGSAELIVNPGHSAVVVKLGLRVLARKILRITAGKKHLWELPEANTPASIGLSAPSTAPSRGWRRFARLHWGTFTALAGTTVALFIGALATSARAKSIHDDYAADPTNTALRDRGLRAQRITNALWGVTIVSAASTAVVALFTRWKDTERARRFTAQPTLGPGAAGLRLSWKY